MVNYLFLLLTSQGFLLSILFLGHNRIKKKRFLAGYTFAFALMMFSWFLYWEPSLPRIVRLIAFDRPVQFFLGPLLICYLFPSIRWVSVRMIPLVVAIVFLVMWTIMLSPLNIPSSIRVYIPNFHTVTYFSGILLNIFFTIFIFRKGIRNDQLLIFSTLPLLVLSQVGHEILIRQGSISLNLDFFIGFIINGIFCSAGYVLLVREKKYANTKLESKELNHLVLTVEDFMKRETPFKRPDLTLSSLANALSVHPKKLSQVLNQGFEKSFSDFINKYRVEFAKQMLASSADEKITILEIMYKSGFNSKSAFNHSFKKFTGTTPKSFKLEKSLISAEISAES